MDDQEICRIKHFNILIIINRDKFLLAAFVSFFSFLFTEINETLEESLERSENNYD